MRFLPAILISAVWAGKVFANGFALPDQDAFATARGEAFAATADNPSAIFYNPAGITQLEGDNFRGGVYGIYLDPSYSRLGSSQTFHSSDHFAAVPQLFYVHSLQNLPLSFGLGIYAPFGGSMNWPQNTGFRRVAISGSLQYITINPAVAWKIVPSLSIGAGVMVNYVNLKTSQGLLATNQPFVNFFNFSGDGWSAGYNAGILWQPVKEISIGANFRSSARVMLNGQTHYEQRLGIQNSYRPANMSMNFPLTAVAGISYRPTPKWNLEFDANYTDWSSFGTTTIYQQGTVPAAIKQNIPVNLDWQGSWMYEFGATRYFDSGWHVSGGYVFNENSVPNQFYTPLAADIERQFSIGAGRKGKTFDFDVTYQFGYGPTHTVTGSSPSSKPSSISNPPGADGKYGFNSSALMLTVGMHF